MNKTLKFIGGFIILILAIYLIWYFADILVYVLIAGVLSFVGQPLVRIYDKIHFRKYKIPHSISAVLSLITMLIAIVLFFLIFVPIITRQAEVFSEIDFEYVGEQIIAPLTNAELKLHEYGLLSEEQSLEEILYTEVDTFVQMISVEAIFSNVLGLAGSIFIGLFSIIFLTFFFLRDEHLFFNGIMLFVPTRFESQGATILSKTRHLLSRYFVGLVLEVVSMMTLITVFLMILGVKNAFLIGFLGGLMNIIPYLGPIIGASMGVIIGTSTALGMGMYDELLKIALFIVASFAGANLIDNFILQPLIYSKSVKAHPIEIFLVILMAASIAGIPGMILAIPAYTVLRIVAQQFFSQIKLVRKLTEDI